MSSSEFSQELESLNAQIEQLQLAVVKLEDEKRVVETKLDDFAIERQNIGLLEEACNALDKLNELGVAELFWSGLAASVDPQDHTSQVRERIETFSRQTRGLNDRRQALQAKIDQHLSVMEYLFDEVAQAEEREERRVEEFAVVREMSELPVRQLVMPWSVEAETERRFRYSLLIALFWCVLLGVLTPLVNVPIPDRVQVVMEIPARMAMLLKEEPRKVPPKPAQIVEKQKPEVAEAEKPKKAKAEEKVAKNEPQQQKKKADNRLVGGGTKGVKKKQSVGVLAFKSSFDDLMDEVPVAKLGSEAKVNKVNAKVPGEARASRSLVSTQAKSGGSSGISNFGVSRNLGNGGSGGGSGYGNAGQIGGVGTGQVESAMAGMAEQAGRPLSSSADASRTDEEIQIVFDRYKAALYRIYNRELRKDPTLRGRITLKLTIEPDGSVSMCLSESTDLASDELVAQIVERIKRFNFGLKDGVPKVTIRYPIDFLPAG